MVNKMGNKNDDKEKTEEFKQVIKKIAEEHGTPVFIVDHEKIRQNYKELKDNLPRVQIYYAVKANTDQEIIKTE